MVWGWGVAEGWGLVAATGWAASAMAAEGAGCRTNAEHHLRQQAEETMPARSLLGAEC